MKLLWKFAGGGLRVLVSQAEASVGFCEEVLLYPSPKG